MSIERQFLSTLFILFIAAQMLYGLYLCFGGRRAESRSGHSKSAVNDDADKQGKDQIEASEETDTEDWDV